MGTRLPLIASLFNFALIGAPLYASAESPATQLLELTPAAAPASVPASTRYREFAPSRYPDTVVTYYPASPRPAPSEFAAGTFELSLGGQGFTAHGDQGNDTIGFVTFDAGWYFINTLSVNLELGLSPGTFDRHHRRHDDEDDGLRAEEELVSLRWHFLTLGGLSLYADGGVGGLHASPDFPSDGRRDNFLAAAGGGLTIELAHHCYAGLGARAAWLSGGDWNGNHRDHHWSDGVQYYGQLSFVFP